MVTTMTRRTIFSGGGAAALAALAGPATAASDEPVDPPAAETIRMLVDRSEAANAALMRGDVATYRELVTLSDDFVLMSPFGGAPSRAGALDDEAWDAIGRYFRNGTLCQELVASYAVTDMVVLVVIEHGHGEVGGLPTQDWPLRVTLVYRRHGAAWLLAHRHADPLARGITLRQSAALARAGVNAWNPG